MNRQHELKWGGRKHLWHPREAKDLHQWLAVINNFKSSCITIWSACVHLKSHQSNLCYDHTVERGRCVCVSGGYQFGFYGIWSRAVPSSPPLALTLGGNYVVMWLPHSSWSPHLVPWAQSCCLVGPPAAPAPRSRLKAPGLILNLLALAFS